MMINRFVILSMTGFLCACIVPGCHFCNPFSKKIYINMLIFIEWYEIMQLIFLDCLKCVFVLSAHITLLLRDS
jgi:hypothetical protein